MIELLLTTLLFLVSSHFIADYIFQTDAIAVGKNRRINKVHLTVPWYYWMITHSIAHGVGVYLVTQNVYLFLIEATAHFIIDTAKCHNMINLHTDQFLHIACKVFYVFVIFSEMAS